MMLPSVSPPSNLSENDRPGDAKSCPGGTEMFGVLIAGFSSSVDIASSRSWRLLCRLALYRPRVVDIELDMIAGKGRRGNLRRALRRVESDATPPSG